jgi:hypothetical protein
MTEGATPGTSTVAVTTAPSERGWGKLLLAIAAFLFVPSIPQMAALLPIEQTTMLFVPAMAACALVGWWAGGRAFLAVAWVAIAALLATRMGTNTAFDNLARGWSLLLAGSFGLVCLFNPRRPLFARALGALVITLVLATIMCLVGPVSASQASKIVSEELMRRNTEWMTTLNTVILQTKDWAALTAKIPALADFPAETERQLTAFSQAGVTVFPALLALQSLAALALAWATYHRLSRARIGAPLRPLKEFRFNDQLVWGLIVGLTFLLLPTLRSLHGAGKNLLVFFAALYAVRGFGVLSWFMAPGSLGVTLTVGIVMLMAPVLKIFAVLAFMMLGVSALALGLGDTWADWRSRARPTSS